MNTQIHRVELPGSIVTTDWLEQHLGAPGLVIIDIRGYVKSAPVDGGEPGQEKAIYTGALDEYEAGHIPGSVYIDWTKDIVDLDDPVPAQIASPEQFAARMSALGIGDDTAVVVVDHTGGHFAGRIWWALRYHGHTNVALLDGGWNKWVAEERPSTTNETDVIPASFTSRVQSGMRSKVDDVARSMTSGDALIVDARDAMTFSGETWRGARKGHIPGAINLPTKSLVNADGTWKSDEELAQLVSDAGISRDTPVIAYCNGGVTATGVLFALDRLGIKNWSNYDGSWNEWSERSDLPTESNWD